MQYLFYLSIAKIRIFLHAPEIQNHGSDSPPKTTYSVFQFKLTTVLSKSY